jgi:hypothetical protein
MQRAPQELWSRTCPSRALTGCDQRSFLGESTRFPDGTHARSSSLLGRELGPRRVSDKSGLSPQLSYNWSPKPLCCSQFHFGRKQPQIDDFGATSGLGQGHFLQTPCGRVARLLACRAGRSEAGRSSGRAG